MARDLSEARAVIMADAEIRTQYIDETGATCAIGGLLKNRGVDAMAMLLVNFRSIYSLEQFDEVLASYGLSKLEAKQIQKINDYTEGRAERHRLIGAYLDELEAQE